MQAEAIKNIIFDFGGVLINIDYAAPVHAFAQLGIKDFNRFYSQQQQTDLFDRLETGKISAADFRNTIRQVSGINLTDEQIDQAWNSILLDLPEERLELLYALRKKYRLFLLSNTNDIHVKAFETSLMKQYGKNIFEELFEAHYFSSSLGMRKPDPETFEKIIQLNHLQPQDTLFIDDSPQHIEGAAKAGLQTLWLDVKNSDIVRELSDFL